MRCTQCRIQYAKDTGPVTSSVCSAITESRPYRVDAAPAKGAVSQCLVLLSKHVLPNL